MFGETDGGILQVGNGMRCSFQRRLARHDCLINLRVSTGTVGSMGYFDTGMKLVRHLDRKTGTRHEINDVV